MEEFIQRIIKKHKKLENMKQGIKDGSKSTHLSQKKRIETAGERNWKIREEIAIAKKKKQVLTKG